MALRNPWPQKIKQIIITNQLNKQTKKKLQRKRNLIHKKQTKKTFKEVFSLFFNQKNTSRVFAVHKALSQKDA